MHSTSPKEKTSTDKSYHHLWIIGLISIAVGLLSFVLEGFPKGIAASFFYANGMILLLAYRSKRDLKQLEEKFSGRSH